MKRSQKKLEKLKKNFDRRRELYHLMKQYGDDIMRSDNFKSTRNYVQHGTIPVRRHCLDVAQHSLAINRKLRIHCQEKDLVRGHCCMIISFMTGMIKTGRIISLCMDFIIRELHLRMRRRNIS